MRDPLEGLNPDGTIRTGVDRGRVPAPFEAVVAEVIGEFRRTQPSSAELHLYGSVATGTARPGVSDVDLLVVDGVDGWADEVGARLSRRFADLCRGVEIGTARRSDFTGRSDEGYGNQVFLRHYCVSLAGPDDIRPRAPFAGDARAVRGLNGDIARCLDRWRTGGTPARRVARKTLVAAAGIVSVRTGTWTTDRAIAAEGLGLTRLLGWADGTTDAAPNALEAALAPGGVVAEVAGRFADEIGLWAGSDPG